MNREEKIRLLGLIVLAGFVCSVSYHYVLGVYWQMSYPHNTFLFRPEDRFNDFRNLFNLVAHPGAPNPLSQYSSDWFQFLFAVPMFFALFGLSANMATALYLLCFAGAFLWICRLNLGGTSGVETGKNVLLCAVLSYPFLFAVDRANLEGVVFLLVFMFVRALQRERYNQAMIWLGLALAMKPFPIVLVLLLLIKKRFREVVGAGAICLSLNAIASYVQFGTLLPHRATGLVNYQATHVYGNEGLYFGHSLWGVIKVVAFEFSPQIQIPALAQIYFLFSVTAFLLLSWCIWRQKIHFWQQVALLICAMNLFPFVSADYKLLYLFLPLFLFVNQSNAGQLDKIYCILFGLLLIPKAYGHLAGLPEAHYGILINPLLMVCLAVVIVLSQKNRTQPSPEVSAKRT